MSAAVVYLERVNEMYRKELNRKGLIKVYSYNDYLNEIKKFKLDGLELAIKGREFYVNGKLKVIWLDNSGGVSEREPHSVRFKSTTWHTLELYAKILGCGVSNIIDYIVEEQEKRGGVKTPEIITGIKSMQ